VAVILLMLGALALNLAHNGLGLGGERFEVLLNAWLQNVVLGAALLVAVLRVICTDSERGGWIALTVGIACWSLGNLYWNLVLYSVEEPPFPSPADAGWLLFYPFAYACIGLRVRSAARDLPRSLWLDGIVGLLSVGAVGTVLVVAPVLAGAQGSRVAVLTNAAYPLCDLLLFGLCVAVFALHGWRPGRAWIGLALGFGLFAAADSIYLMRLAAGTYAPGSVLDSAWVVGLVVMSLAAWQRPPRAREVELGGRASVVLPLAFALGALVVLIAGSQQHLPLIATVLAGAAMLSSMVRTALTFADIGRLAEVRRLAATDQLTGLPNRREFDRRLEQELARAHVCGERLALLLIDLDRFKELNDALGHHAGDLVLAQVGPRLRTVLRSEDVLARVGGDEFAILLPGAVGVEEVGRRLGEALDRRLSVDGIDTRIVASVGIAVYPEHGADAHTLLQHADVAMYQAKSTHTGFAFYERERDRNTRQRFETVGELRDAIDTSQLVLHYQPKLNLESGDINEVEALVRWQHPVRGLLPPAEFVGLAEQTGVMRGLTDHVLDAALAQAAKWSRSGLDLGVAVNVSASTLLDETWAAKVSERLCHHGVPSSRLRIEITEDALMLDPERSLVVLRSLADTGVGLSIDDFGTGYSSLGLLKQLPVDELKIDRSFISKLADDDDDAAIAQTAIDLGRRLRLTVVPEGVEDADTLARLATWGATSAQGFFISRPVPAAELEIWLAARSSEPLVSWVTTTAPDQPDQQRPVARRPTAA